MASYTIEIDETFDVPRRKVFALFADHHRFGKMIGAPVKRIKDSDQVIRTVPARYVKSALAPVPAGNRTGFRAGLAD